MSCISPIDIKGITKPCTTGCSYKYNYGKGKDDEYFKKLIEEMDINKDN